MSQMKRQSDEPRAVIHRRILDLADDMPEASLEKIADGVSGASAELVDRVLREYGDPSNEPSDEPGDGDDADADSPESADTGDADVDPTESVDTEDTDADPLSGTEDEDGVQQDATELSETQLETLGLVARNPDATQRELAAELDVTAATVSRWVNDISGFDWSNREAFARSVLDDDVDDTAGSGDGPDETAGSNGSPDETAGSDEDSRDATGTNRDVIAGSDGHRDDSSGSDVSASSDTPNPITIGSDMTTGDMLEKMNGNTENSRIGEDTGSEDDRKDEVADLRQRVVVIEDRLTEESSDTMGGEVSGDSNDADSDRIGTELLHEVVDACMSSERMTEEEEIRLLDHLRD